MLGMVNGDDVGRLLLGHRGLRRFDCDDVGEAGAVGRPVLRCRGVLVSCAAGGRSMGSRRGGLCGVGVIDSVAGVIADRGVPVGRTARGWGEIEDMGRRLGDIVSGTLAVVRATIRIGVGRRSENRLRDGGLAHDLLVVEVCMAIATVSWPLQYALFEKTTLLTPSIASNAAPDDHERDDASTNDHNGDDYECCRHRLRVVEKA